jgi:hypothetical protein
MKSFRPGILATRAVNQYRRRDVLTFLGLRYYLANTASRSDGWIRNVALDLAGTRIIAGYFHAHHFKERDAGGLHKHRALHLPGANEALAEASLLAECAKYPEVFSNPDCVFSYRLTKGKSRAGVFEPYFKGLKERHNAIAKAAAACPTGVVQYVDIKKFYPTISGEKSLEVWNRCCEKAGLEKPFAELGRKLIADHIQVPRDQETGILTGPMFSHLLANLVLHDLDKDLSASLPVPYFRYVDDITLVGSGTEVDQALQVIEVKLGELGFCLHPDGHEKRLRVESSEWLGGVRDFDEPTSLHTWASLVGDLKQFLFYQKGDQADLRRRFREGGFRLPIPDYAALSSEASRLERLVELLEHPRKWLQRKLHRVTENSLIAKAEWLREHYEVDLLKLLAQLPDACGFQRKRLVPKTRYAAGRLIYLSNQESLSRFSEALLNIPELYLYGRVMQALTAGSVDHLLGLGVNAAQAAAQAFAANDQAANLSAIPQDEGGRQSLAVLIANGVHVQGVELNDGSELLRLALQGCDRDLMKSDNPFIRELACLHGLAPEARHAEMFRTVFDQDDDLVMDAVDQLQDYPSP